MASIHNLNFCHGLIALPIPTIAQVTVDTNSYILDIINKFIINEAHIKHNAKGRSQRNK